MKGKKNLYDHLITKTILRKNKVGGLIISNHTKVIVIKTVWCRHRNRYANIRYKQPRNKPLHIWLLWTELYDPKILILKP